MGQINTTNLSNAAAEAQATGPTLRPSTKNTSASTPAENAVPQDALQLTKLSGVLNSLKKGASTMRSQMTSVMTSVRGGTYEIDPLQVSRSIVGESLSSR